MAMVIDAIVGGIDDERGEEEEGLVQHDEEIGEEECTG